MKSLSVFILLFFCGTISSAQKKAKLDSIIIARLSKDTTTSVRWAYHPEENNLNRLDMPAVSKALAGEEFYEVELRYQFYYHIGRATGLIVLNPKTLKTSFSPPMWFNDVDTGFLKRFIGVKFKDPQEVKAFMEELQYMIAHPSGGRFENLAFIGDSITSDYFIFQNNKWILWRQFEVLLTNNAIKGFKSTNPISKKAIIVKE